VRYSNQCPNCGGIARHIITDKWGRNYYRCMTGLTSFKSEIGETVSSGTIIPCDTIIDQEGKKLTGTIAYKVGSRTETLSATDGKERR